MNPEIIAALAGAVAAIVTALSTYSATRSRMNREELKDLRKALSLVRREQSEMAVQLMDARKYIRTLLWVLADHGISPPQPPESLTLPD